MGGRGYLTLDQFRGDRQLFANQLIEHIRTTSTQPRDHIPCPTVHYASFSLLASPRHWFHLSQFGVTTTQQVSHFVQLQFSYNKTDGTTCHFCVALIRVATNTLFLSFAELSPSQRIILHASPVFCLKKHLHAWHAWGQLTLAFQPPPPPQTSYPDQGILFPNSVPSEYHNSRNRRKGLTMSHYFTNSVMQSP